MTRSKLHLSIFFFSLLLAFAGVSAADDNETLLKDRTGDEVVTVLAFGDSLTYGVGDGNAPGIEKEELPREQAAGGYPKRVQALAGIPVINAGIPGEQLVVDGSNRFIRALRSSRADVALLLQGSNDANLQVPLGTYRNALQRSLNAAVALGREPVILTLPPPCCNRASLRPFTDSFVKEQQRLAFFNELPLADIARAFASTCDDINKCNLLNVPEGLHPNSLGYDVIAQTVLATLYGIDIFSQSGASELAGALGVEPSSIKVKPEAAPVAPTVAPDPLATATPTLAATATPTPSSVTGQ